MTLLYLNIFITCPQYPDIKKYSALPFCCVQYTAKMSQIAVSKIAIELNIELKKNNNKKRQVH